MHPNHATGKYLAFGGKRKPEILRMQKLQGLIDLSKCFSVIVESFLANVVCIDLVLISRQPLKLGLVLLVHGFCAKLICVVLEICHLI